MQEEYAKTLLRKLKIRTLLDLALIIPSSYHDTTLSKSLDEGAIGTYEAVVEKADTLRGRMHVTFFLEKFGIRIRSIFFRTTPYHHRLFASGSHHIIQGKLERYRGELQMPQPKSLKESGVILPKYKTVLKQEDMSALIRYYLTEKNLYDEGLDSHEAAVLMHVHFPETLEGIYTKGSFSDDAVKVFKFVEAYNHLKKLRHKKIDFPAKTALTGAIDPFVSTLPFTLTPEQKEVITAIQADLSREDKAAKRMVVGDVGSGKTMVILASAMMALPHKSILMAPTSLLALQLYEEARKHLPDTISIALVMQGKEEGSVDEADFIIGTHALLHRKDLPDAALVMVDEQHRFGTNQRQALEALVSQGEKKPHFLQFSATPIPRTQAMMDSELLDVSLITSTPFVREVTTEVIGREAFPELLSHIKEEIAKDHQVLIIYPLVEESSEIPYQSLQEAQGFWQERFENVYVTHGKDKEKEEVLLAFREQGNILLATTVVEVGISLPRLTLIVIVGAERLGLATLHQLRGRVGRSGLESWCYLFTNTSGNHRLAEFSQTTNGFDIAKLDLKYRDSGDIIDGTIQSGQKFRWLDMGEDEAVIVRAKERLQRNA